MGLEVEGLGGAGGGGGEGFLVWRLSLWATLNSPNRSGLRILARGLKVLLNTWQIL